MIPNTAPTIIVDTRPTAMEEQGLFVSRPAIPRFQPSGGARQEASPNPRRMTRKNTSSGFNPPTAAPPPSANVRVTIQKLE